MYATVIMGGLIIQMIVQASIEAGTIKLFCGATETIATPVANIWFRLTGSSPRTLELEARLHHLIAVTTPFRILWNAMMGLLALKISGGDGMVATITFFGAGLFNESRFWLWQKPRWINEYNKRTGNGANKLAHARRESDKLVEKRYRGFSAEDVQNLKELRWAKHGPIHERRIREEQAKERQRLEKARAELLQE